MSWEDIAEYETLRLKYPIHKLRFATHAAMVQSGPGQTIMRAADGHGYQCFRLVEAGIEIPLENVASAIPKGVPLAAKLRKTTGSRLTEKPQQATRKPPKDVPRKTKESPDAVE